MIDKKLFKVALGDVFREGGFVGKGQSWYLTGPEVVVLVNLQKSDFDEKYYLNFGVGLKRLGVADFPKENHCHIQARVASLFPDQSDVLERGCCIGEGSDNDLSAMLDLLRSKCIPMFRECLSEGGLKSLLVAGWFKKALVMKVAKDALFIE